MKDFVIKLRALFISNDWKPTYNEEILVKNGCILYLDDKVQPCATTENLGTVSDASMSDSLPVMETDNMVTAKQLTIGEEEYTGKDVKHYSSDDNKTTKLEVYFELDAETAQLYCDEMESNMQNGSVDAEPSYVSDDVFCYHLVANKVYQYGKWSDAKLQLLELSDNVSKDTADSAALEYFGKEEYK